MRLYHFLTEDEIGDKDIEAATFEEALAAYLTSRRYRPGVTFTVVNDRGQERTLTI